MLGVLAGEFGLRNPSFWLSIEMSCKINVFKDSLILTKHYVNENIQCYFAELSDELVIEYLVHLFDVYINKQG